MPVKACHILVYSPLAQGENMLTDMDFWKPNFFVLNPNFTVSTQISYSLGKSWGFILASLPQRKEKEENCNKMYLQEPVTINEPL